jgi:hypothetical protein
VTGWETVFSDTPQVGSITQRMTWFSFGSVRDYSDDRPIETDIGSVSQLITIRMNRFWMFSSQEVHVGGVILGHRVRCYILISSRERSHESVSLYTKHRSFPQSFPIFTLKTFGAGELVYYESRKRELKTRLMNEGRCDEKLKVRFEESTYLTYTGLHDKTNLELPRDKDEVHK